MCARMWPIKVWLWVGAFVSRMGGVSGWFGYSISVPVSCTGSASCTVKLALTAAETLQGGKVIAVTASSSKTKKKLIGLGSVTVTIAAGHSKIVKITLNRSGYRLLAKRHKLPAKLTISRSTSGKATTIATKEEGVEIVGEAFRGGGEAVFVELVDERLSLRLASPGLIASSSACQ